ncbi:MAG: hypothetical protein CAPSK01_003256 [Candidatus Accumulibacter vicinus]|uniref:Uncharacterized protein n=1 Tax=Candidatus Accumulibacter vicinus TaxID=2954382 RepID=A0A084XXZ4_9PROT|nr:MAG: hypothetical protein CAPSK01_003256 [Candidatus Accumulibacter vicinus]
MAAGGGRARGYRWCCRRRGTAGGADDIRQVHREATATLGRALDIDPAAQQFDELAADRQAQAGAAVLACAAAIDLLEGVEDGSDLVGRDADAAVDDVETQPPVLGAQHEPHRPLIGELDGVRQQVGQDLGQQATVTADDRRRCGFDLDGESDRLLCRERLEQAAQVKEDLGDREVLDQHLDLAGLDLRQVEDVVDQRQELVAALVDDARRLDFIVIEVTGRILGQMPGQDQNAVQRCAQFMRHVGQELRFVTVGLREFARPCLGLATAEFELSSLRFQTAVLLCQFLLLHPQFLLGAAQGQVLCLEFVGLGTHFVAQRQHGAVLVGKFGFLLAQDLGLPATFIEQREIALGGFDVRQLQSERPHQGCEKSVLVGRQPARRRQFDDRQRLVLMRDRVEHEFLGRELGQPGGDQHQTAAHRCQDDRLAIAGALTDQRFAGREAVLRLAAPNQSLGAGTPVVAVGVAQKERRDGNIELLPQMSEEDVGHVGQSFPLADGGSQRGDVFVNPAVACDRLGHLAKTFRGLGHVADFVLAVEAGNRRFLASGQAYQCSLHGQYRLKQPPTANDCHRGCGAGNQQAAAEHQPLQRIQTGQRFVTADLGDHAPARLVAEGAGKRLQLPVGDERRLAAIIDELIAAIVAGEHTVDGLGVQLPLEDRRFLVEKSVGQHPAAAADDKGFTALAESGLEVHVPVERSEGDLHHQCP